MDTIFDVIARRRSVRAFRPEQVAEEDLQAVLAAGRAAPSGGDNRTTHLIVVQQPAALAQLRDLVV